MINIPGGGMQRIENGLFHAGEIKVNIRKL